MCVAIRRSLLQGLNSCTGELRFLVILCSARFNIDRATVAEDYFPSYSVGSSLTNRLLDPNLSHSKTVIEEKNVEQARELYRHAASHLDRAAQKGVIKKGTANRKKSRLARRINSMAAA